MIILNLKLGDVLKQHMIIKLSTLFNKKNIREVKTTNLKINKIKFLLFKKSINKLK
jgi:hypothetical protein